MDKDVRIISTTEELKVISDPFRLRIINVYKEHEGPLTVKGCADILNEVPAKVHYHVQKLLSINVLVLDHVEIVNGINAKFYKLPNTTLQLQLDEADNQLESNLKHITNVAISQLENFKMDFLNSIQNASKNKIEDLYDVGWLSSTKVYLSEEEFSEVQKQLFEMLSKYKDKDENKKKYLLISGLSKQE